MTKFPALSLLIGWLALMALLGANLAISFTPLGPGSPAISLSIAAAQVAILVLVLMKIGRTAPLVRIFAVCGIFWLIILFGLSGIDYATRSPPGFAVSLAHGRSHRDRFDR